MEQIASIIPTNEEVVCSESIINNCTDIPDDIPKFIKVPNPKKKSNITLSNNVLALSNSHLITTPNNIAMLELTETTSNSKIQILISDKLPVVSNYKKTLSQKTCKELRKICKDTGIKGYSKKQKYHLIKLLEAVQPELEKLEKEEAVQTELEKLEKEEAVQTELEKLEKEEAVQPELEKLEKEEAVQPESDKQYIIDLFNSNVKGIPIDVSGINGKHCGKVGHWLEKKMGIKPNGNNVPDINGYEMKIESPKITFGDFGACEYAFSSGDKRPTINSFNGWSNFQILTRNDFIKIFGNPNIKKNNRYSWSGKCVPTLNSWNSNGQILQITEDNSIIILYSFSKDTRNDEIKMKFPEFIKKENVMIAIWKSSRMKQLIENKFNKKGFFICKKIGETYQKICFGKKFDFEYFIKGMKEKKIIFDSGMYEGNSRNYSQFRASNFWNELITDEY